MLVKIILLGELNTMNNINSTVSSHPAKQDEISVPVS